jgi:predicted RNA-binding Zn ribbon-like protein
MNTVSWRGKEEPEDHLSSFHDLIHWGQKTGILLEQDADTLLRNAADHPAEAENVLKQAIELREALYRIVSSVVQGVTPFKKDLSMMNKRLSRAMSHANIVKTETGFSWNFDDHTTAFDWILNPIIRSAAELLVSEELKKLKTCADPTCGWVFLDKSRNNSRRWCDMKDCGNRAKANRFYKRKQQARFSRTPTETDKES